MNPLTSWCSGSAQSRTMVLDASMPAVSRLEICDGIPILRIAGSPGTMGAQAGALVGERTRALLRLVRMRTLTARMLRPRRLELLIAGIGERHHVELSELAACAGVALPDLMTANILVDSMCSALVGLPGDDQPLRVARNMDFFPASIIGPRTVVVVMRPHHRHALISIGWPGFSGVVSGMNDAGLTACVLINQPQRHVWRPGQPICFRIREILERCATVAQAEACFAEDPVASSHYVLLADATNAAVVWQGLEGCRRDSPTHGWLAASNGRREHGLPCDRRGRILMQRAEAMRTRMVGEQDMRSTLQASYLPLLNAQSMVFTPATRSVAFALGNAFRPAARSSWHRLDGAPLLDGHPARTSGADCLWSDHCN